MTRKIKKVVSFEVVFAKIGEPEPVDKGKRTYEATSRPKRQKKPKPSNEDKAKQAKHAKSVAELREWAAPSFSKASNVTSVPTAPPPQSKKINWNDGSEDGSMWDR